MPLVSVPPCEPPAHCHPCSRRARKRTSQGHAQSTPCMRTPCAHATARLPLYPGVQAAATVVGDRHAISLLSQPAVTTALLGYSSALQALFSTPSGPSAAQAAEVVAAVGAAGVPAALMALMSDVTPGECACACHACDTAPRRAHRPHAWRHAAMHAPRAPPPPTTPQRASWSSPPAAPIPTAPTTSAGRPTAASSHHSRPWCSWRST
jgi:hypothetical protein